MQKDARILNNIQKLEEILENGKANKPSKVKRKLYELNKELKRCNSIRKVVR